MSSYTLFLLSMPLVILLGLVSSVVLAGAVRTGSLKTSVRKVFDLRKTFHLFLLSIGLLLCLLVISLPLSMGIYLYSSGLTPLYLAGGAAVTLALTLYLSYRIYFLPVTLLDSSLLESVRQASRTSSRNRKNVVSLTLLSLVLLLIALTFQGTLERLGYAGFVAGRVLSSVVNTYLFVVSPTYYEEVSS